MVGPWAGCSQEKFQDQEETVEEILVYAEHVWNMVASFTCS